MGQFESSCSRAHCVRASSYTTIDGGDHEDSTFALVLATVNAPYREKLDAHALMHYLPDHDAAKAMPGHTSSFFGEVEPALQVEFAHHFNITNKQLAFAAKSFAAYSRQSYPVMA